MSWRGIAEFGGFQMVWFACALGAAWGSNAAGLIAAGVFVILQVTSRTCMRAALTATLASGVVGFGFESALAAAGLVRYEATWLSGSIGPPWIVALWLAFGTTLATTARLLGPIPLMKASALGAILGPMSYIAGDRLGALAISAPLWPALLAIAAGWAIAFPGLIALSRGLEKRSQQARSA